MRVPESGSDVTVETRVPLRSTVRVHQAMTAKIVKHGEFSDNYDDPNHPIPSITAIDINTVKTSGGSDLFVIVAAPLAFDEKSQKRVLDKIELYLTFIQTAGVRGDVRSRHGRKYVNHLQAPPRIRSANR